MNGENGVSFAERINQSIEIRIEADKIKNTRENGVDLLKNSTALFGADTEDKRLELMDRVFARYGKGDKSFQDMVDRSNNPNGNKKVAVADKESFVRSTFVAINASVSGDSLVTDEMSADDIDSYLPESCKGVGGEIKGMVLSQNEANGMIEIGKNVSILTDVDKPASVKVEALKKITDLVKDEPENSLMKQYAVVSTSIVEGIGEEDGSVRSRQNFRPRANQEGEFEGGVEMAWQVTADKLADAMQFMDPSVRWPSYTPPEWFKRLDGETQARIEYMMMICEGASFLNRAGTDVDKIRQNPMYFAFDNKKMTTLFNSDFKLVMSKMLNDLCEFYSDSNGRQSLRYKEDINNRGKQGVSKKVEDKIFKIRSYENELAEFLAKQNGRTEATYLDKMNAYTAWNLFFMMGDSSLCDRRRCFGGYSNVVSDGIRTLNPEYKAKNKWKVTNGGEIGDSDILDDAEWYGGPLAAYVQTIMRIENEGGAIDGVKLRDKIINGQLKIFANKTCYGFFDFINGGRDLFASDGVNFYDKDKGRDKNLTLAQLLMGYASFDKDGVFKGRNSDYDFSFGDKEVDFMKFFRDQQDTSALILSCLTGKVDLKDKEKFVNDLRTAFGTVSGIKCGGERFFNYTKKPDLWANVLLGVFGVDMNRLSTNHIRLKSGLEGGYNFFVRNLLVRTLKLNDADVDLIELMRYLGVDINEGERLDSIIVTARNEREWKMEERRTRELRRKYGGYFG